MQLTRIQIGLLPLHVVDVAHIHSLSDDEAEQWIKQRMIIRLDKVFRGVRVVFQRIEMDVDDTMVYLTFLNGKIDEKMKTRVRDIVDDVYKTLMGDIGY